MPSNATTYSSLKTQRYTPKSPTTLISHFLDTLQETPNNPLYIFSKTNTPNDTSYTYADIYNSAHKIAQHLHTLGIKKGDRVILLLPQNIHFIEVFFACILGGYIAVPCYPPRLNDKNNHLSNVIHDCTPELIITTSQIQKTLFMGTPEFGGEYASIATLLPTGKGTSASHLTATDEKFVEGEATIIELSGVNKRYHCPMARTVLLGKPDQKKIDAMKATNEALDAGIAATKPGNTADDVAQKFWAVLDKYNIKKESRTGYSIGIGYPPDWGEHTLNIYKGDMTVLQPNVCFHMIAVMQFGDWGVEASESVRVTEKGSECFCNFSRELHIK